MDYHNNSVMYKNMFDESNLVDLSKFGIKIRQAKTMIIHDNNHTFLNGEVVYYDNKAKRYYRALAVNNIMSEVVGIVSDVIDKDTFELTTKGFVKTNRYSEFENDSLLYLSRDKAGSLTDTEPEYVSKIIGTKVRNGIEVDIQRGYISEDEPQQDFRYYTSQEIRDIIRNIKGTI